MSNNPYQFSSAEIASPDKDSGELEMAERMDRLIANLLDGVLVMVPTALLIGAGVLAILGAQGNFDESASYLIAAILGLVGLALCGALLYYQLNMFAESGQTWGRRKMSIKIVRTDGSRVSVGRLIVYRNLVIQAISMIPFVGGIVPMVDILMIFRDNRLCLHDQIADTKVVKA
ncbi:MAG: RDD family protein [Fibrobacterota bacterium]|nr:RDD family protein [Fibrobacterota bacterium]QQS04930.1 MAG: RDD family protein [Fibrobacterota bacterium]